jgi:hypothetical protein
MAKRVFIVKQSCISLCGEHFFDLVKLDLAVKPFRDSVLYVSPVAIVEGCAYWGLRAD